MGFYGNITNTSLTHFQFDEAFDSRCAMDDAAAAGTDGVFQGRFVIVRYDPEGTFFESDIVSGYKKEDDDGLIYVDHGCTIPYTYSQFSDPIAPANLNAANWNSYYKKVGSYYFKLPNQAVFDASATNYCTPLTQGLENILYSGQIVRLRNQDGFLTSQYYICNGEDESHNAIFTTITEIADLPPYLTSYAIDKARYGVGFDWRSYDATVWQKVYQNGVGKFILIARLNGSIPAVQLVTKSPTLEPSWATIQAQSDALYQIGIPGHWGLQIKEATAANGESIKSDQNVIQIDDSTDPPTTTTYPADIYMNLGVQSGNIKVSHAERSYKETNMENKIILDPSGESGKTYYDENGNLTGIDTLELSVHIPAIGNMIDQGYDLIYGTKSDEDPTRPRDIEWYGGEQTELKTNGRIDYGGKTYDLSTLAGCINEMHNKLGQIIVTIPNQYSAADLNNHSPDYIYYVEADDKYYRIGTDYEYIPLTDNEYVYTLADQQAVANDYSADTYYISNNGDTDNPTYNVSHNPLTAEEIAQGYLYYQRDITNELYTEIDLQEYSQNTYWYKEGVNYIKDLAELPTSLSQSYYTINENNNAEVEQYPMVYFNGEYTANRYFYKLDQESTDYYFLDTNVDPTSDRIYWDVIVDPEFDYTDVIFYEKNKFFASDGEGGYTQIKYNTWNEFKQHFTNNDTVYWLEFDETISNVSQYLDDEGEIQVVISHPLKENGAHPLSVRDLRGLPSDLSTLYYVSDGSYIHYSVMNDYIITNPNIPNYAAARSYVIITDEVVKDKLFIKDTYYYKNEDGSFILSHDSLNAHNMYYRILVAHLIEKPFYVPNVYYYQPDIFRPATHTHMLPDTQYYTKNRIFVISDSAGICPVGYEWNEQALYVPASVRLGRQNKISTMIEISNFVNDNFSINSNLLLLEKYLEKNNDNTRDKNTFRGSLNILNDYIYMFRKLIPRKFLYVNDFGQITSALDIDYEKVKWLVDNKDNLAWLVNHKTDIETLLNN